MKRNSATFKMLKEISYEMKKFDKKTAVNLTPEKKYELELEMNGTTYRMDLKDFQPFMKEALSFAKLLEEGDQS